MKSRYLSLLCLALMCVPLAPAQTPNQEVYNKIAKVDMLYNIMPLLLTKQQLNDILPVVEKCRSQVRKANAQIDRIYEGVSGLANDTYTKSVESGVMPPDSARTKLAQALRETVIARNLTITDNVTAAFAAFDRVLNPGQRKVAANTIDITFYEPAAKPKEMKIEDKERAFVRYILLDPVTYEVMLDMLKNAKD